MVAAMRSVLARRALLTSSRIPGRAAAAAHPGVAPAGPLPRGGLPSETYEIPNRTAFAGASAFWSSRRTYVTSQESVGVLPTDLAVGLPVEGEEQEGREELEEEEDAPLNEFLSRFVSMMREKLSSAYPESSRETIDGMLLVIAQKVVSEMEKGGGVLPSVGPSDPSIDLSPDLWRTVWEVSKLAFEETRRTRRREEMKQFLHCDDVKKMCHFASEIGIRGSMLRELRFKWAHEKLEEFDFYRNLERIRQEHHRAEEIEKGEYTAAGGVLGEGDRSEKRPSLTALPQRRGKIKYNVHGLDLSSQNWAEVADKIHDAEKLNASEEPQPIMGECKLVTEEILSLREEDDPSPLLAKWIELLQPKRVDWLALLDRIHQRNPAAYFKVSLLILYPYTEISPKNEVSAESAEFF